MLYNDIEDLNEIIHPFSIVAIKDTFNDYANRYISDRLQPKFSEKEQINKVYQHSLYQVNISQYPDYMKQDEFDIDGVVYKWCTIEQMEDDSNIMSKSKDVVSFVKEKNG